MIGLDGNERLMVWNLRSDFPVQVNGKSMMKSFLSIGDKLTFGTNEFVLLVEQDMGV